MASELNHHVGHSRANECWYIQFYPYQTEQQAKDAAAAFTRPAPAATDTGLETVEHHYFNSTLDSWLPCAFPEMASKEGKETRELVTRSQAEELLAAERARYVEASQRATNEESLKDTMHRGLLRWKERAEQAEADNAALIHDLNRIKDHETELVNDNVAKDARIKELRDTSKQMISNWRNRAEKAEAKLAAAQKALEPFADIADLIDAETEGMAETDELVLHFHDYEFAKWPVSLFRKARAAPGRKPL